MLAAILLIGLAGIFRFVTGQTSFRPFLSESGVAEIQVSPGFEVQLFAEGLSRPRFIAFGPDGVLYVSDDKGGFVYRIYYVG